MKKTNFLKRKIKEIKNFFDKVRVREALGRLDNLTLDELVAKQKELAAQEKELHRVLNTCCENPDKFHDMYYSSETQFYLDNPSTLHSIASNAAKDILDIHCALRIIADEIEKRNAQKVRG